MLTVIERLSKHIKSHHVLHMTLQLIPHMNLDWRKWLLDVCQTGLPAWEDPRLQQPFQHLYATTKIHYQDAIVSVQDFSDICYMIHRSRFMASIVSIHLRSENAVVDDGSNEVLVRGLAKEINASQNYRSPGVNLEALLPSTKEIRWQPRVSDLPFMASGCTTVLQAPMHAYRGFIGGCIIPSRAEEEEYVPRNLFKSCRRWIPDGEEDPGAFHK